MAAAASTDVSTRSSLPPPSPKSPPEYPDLYGKRREVAKVQMLEREISYLEEELKSARNLQPASRCCKEVSDFVMAKPDPLVPTKQKYRRSCRFWRWLCGMPCFNLSWICCCCHCPRCTLRCKLPKCCHCKPCDCCSGCSCSPLKFSCCSSKCPTSNCCRKAASSNCTKCCTCHSTCLDCSCCCKCSCSCLQCPKVNLCSKCIKSCCKPCCFCC